MVLPKLLCGVKLQMAIRSRQFKHHSMVHLYIVTFKTKRSLSLGQNMVRLLGVLIKVKERVFSS
jgi:hypothetical protein